MIYTRGKRSRTIRGMAVALALVVFAGCSGPLLFVDHSYNFNFIEKVAVIPFENLTQTQGAGKQATLIFLTELLASETFDMVEPGEVSKALGEMSLVRTATLNLEQIVQLGKRLKVQALIFGTVSESTVLRSGSTSTPTVSMDLRMVETETGSTVWSASHTEGRLGFFSTFFGLGGKSTSETMQACIHKILKTLIK